jgi:hypothetical protein
MWGARSWPFMRANHIEPDMAAEIFVFEPVLETAEAG